MNKDEKVTIYSLLDNTPYEAKVVKVDEVKDLIILETDQDVCLIPPIGKYTVNVESWIELLTWEKSFLFLVKGCCFFIRLKPT